VMSEIEQWNRRALWLLAALDAQDRDLVEAARERLTRWRQLQERCPDRELRAAAHPPGLQRGPAGLAVEQHRQGCLVLSSGVGTGKTTAMCWAAYHARGDVLWLDAVRVATARTDVLNRYLDRIRRAALVLVDDVGAAGTVGQYESPRVAAVLTAVAARWEPSIVSTNLAPEQFGHAFDAVHQGGRLRDRLAMAPNRWVDLAGPSRRAAAEEPPQGLPPREAGALAFIRAVEAVRQSSQAFVRADVDQEAIAIVHRRLGIADLGALDWAVEEHERGRARIRAEIAALAASMRIAVPPEPDEPGPARSSVLDAVDYVAGELGLEPSEVLERVGRTRTTLRAEDERSVLDLLD